MKVILFAVIIFSALGASAQTNANSTQGLNQTFQYIKSQEGYFHVTQKDKIVADYLFFKGLCGGYNSRCFNNERAAVYKQIVNWKTTLDLDSKILSADDTTADICQKLAALSRMNGVLNSIFGYDELLRPGNYEALNSLNMEVDSWEALERKFPRINCGH